jgi:hypothetical protein
MRLRVPALLALLVLAVVAAAPPARAQEPLDTGRQKAADGVAHVTDPGRHDAAVADFEGSATHETLLWQQRLSGDLGMRDAPWPGTHNSFNSNAEMGAALSAKDSNQQLTLVDQLRLGVRSLELDVHLWLGRPTVCHAQSQHEGCTVERPLDDVLAPVADWLRAHPREVLLLYAEDHLDDEAGYDAGAAVLRARLGSLLYTPRGSGCTELPDALTRDDVLAAGAQVIVVSDCGPGTGWNAVAHVWSEHRESRPQGFEGFPACGPDFTRAEFDARLIRYYEDSTFLTSGASEVGATSRDDGLTPETTGAMARCGVELLGFDQLVPGDGRLEALAWSWASGVPDEGDCAVSRGSDGRWTTGSCRAARPAACRTAGGAWLVTRSTPARRAAAACDAVGATHAAPRTARENALLRAAAGDRTVLLGLRLTDGTWRALDPRQTPSRRRASRGRAS